MGRRKMVKKCYGCGVAFTWEKGANNADGVFVPNPSGSVRAVEVSTGRIHYCIKRDNIGPNPEPVNPVQPERQPEPVNPLPEFPPVNPEPVDEPEPIIMPEPLRDYGLELTPAGREIYKLIEPAFRAKFEELLKHTQRTVVHVVDVEIDGKRKQITGCHRQMADLLARVALRKNVMLVGPAGTGKTTAAELVAENLGLNFWPMSFGPQTSKTDFFGFTNYATGKAVWTAVRNAYVYGGVLCADEIDASSAAISYMNSILANKSFLFPADVDEPNAINGCILVHKHKDFIVIATANTHGHGANRMYSGKAQIGADTLDRFVGINWDYDTDMELATFGANQEGWVRFVWALRQAQSELNIRAVFGSRKIIDGADMLNAGFSRVDVEESTVWFGVSPDDKAKLAARVRQIEGGR